MTNAKILKAQAEQYKVTQQNAAEIFRSYCTVSPEAAKSFDCEDIDPDSLLKSRKYQMMGSNLTRQLLSLPAALEGGKLKSGAVQFADQLKMEYSLPLEELKKLGDVVIMIFEHQGPACTEEQKKEWKNLFQEFIKIVEDNGY